MDWAPTPGPIPSHPRVDSTLDGTLLRCETIVAVAFFSTGDSIAGHEIVAYVKEGGMASLFLARRHGAAGFQKPVAIKVVHPHLAEKGPFIQMFVDEARLAARIDHPNVVRTDALLEHAGTYVMVMEYVDGVSLFQLLKRLAKRGRRLSPALAVHIAAQIAEGLHAAHELRDGRGDPMHVVHRDVSPQNVLLSWGGHVKVIDFGIAKSRSRLQETRVGVIRGKLAYMSPEQARGKRLDRRTDVYALAIVLWEMLACRRLFRGSDVELLNMVRDPVIPSPRDYEVDLEPALEDALFRALAPDPEDRTPDGQTFRDEILQACPAARRLHASDLSGILEAVLHDVKDDSPVTWDENALSSSESGGFVESHTQAAPDASYGELETSGVSGAHRREAYAAARSGTHLSNDYAAASTSAATPSRVRTGPHTEAIDLAMVEEAQPIARGPMPGGGSGPHAPPRGPLAPGSSGPRVPPPPPRAAPRVAPPAPRGYPAHCAPPVEPSGSSPLPGESSGPRPRGAPVPHYLAAKPRPEAKPVGQPNRLEELASLVDPFGGSISASHQTKSDPGGIPPTPAPERDAVFETLDQGKKSSFVTTLLSVVIILLCGAALFWVGREFYNDLQAETVVEESEGDARLAPPEPSEDDDEAENQLPSVE